MSSLGSYLRELRERRGVSLEEISRATRVGRSYLEALESSDFDKLPAPVFTRGFIRAYCQVLGEPSEEALSRYDNPRTDNGSDPSAWSARDDRTRGRGALLVSFVLLVVLGVALVAMTLVLQSGKEGGTAARSDGPRVESRGPAREVPSSPPAAAPERQQAAPTEDAAPAPSQSVIPSPPGVAQPTTAPPRASTPPGPGPAAPPEGSRPPAAPPASSANTPGVMTKEIDRSIAGTTPPYRLVARAVAPTWVRVRTEDGHSTEETIPAGEVREWVSNRRFTVTVGNAGGVRFELNGKAIPSLGAAGSVVRGLVLPPESP